MVILNWTSMRGKQNNVWLYRENVTCSLKCTSKVQSKCKYKHPIQMLKLAQLAIFDMNKKQQYSEPPPNLAPHAIIKAETTHRPKETDFCCLYIIVSFWLLLMAYGSGNRWWQKGRSASTHGFTLMLSSLFTTSIYGHSFWKVKTAWKSIKPRP